MGVASLSTRPGQVAQDAPDARQLDAGPAPARSTTAAAPSFGEHSIQRWSGSHTTREASTSSAVDLGAEHGVGVVHPVARGSSRRPRPGGPWSRPDSCMSRWARRAK